MLRNSSCRVDILFFGYLFLALLLRSAFFHSLKGSLVSLKPWLSFSGSCLVWVLLILTLPTFGFGKDITHFASNVMDTCHVRHLFS